MIISIEHEKTWIVMARGFNEPCKIENQTHGEEHTESVNRSMKVFSSSLAVLQQIDSTNGNL